ncbi:MAG TPA: ATP-grasp domain-containing protein [Candidatus Polarisedimenticolaceae bacterium]|nr:ATP-grasp domain-containing protein [Candidatus Polarisedimenticolaceae bacterium]
MSVVLVGSVADDHVRALADTLRTRGVDPVLLDSLKYPDGPRLALGDRLEGITLDGIALGTPSSVYLRSLYLSPLAFGVDVGDEMDQNWRTTLVIFREKAELLVSLLLRWEELGVAIYNPLTASDRVRKPYQLARLAAAGLPVPETLWTNDPAAVRRFAAGRRIAYKPVAGGAATQELKVEDLDERRLAALANAPVTFQELLTGEERRVFVLDGEVIAAYRIVSDALDYRQHEQRVESVVLDPPTRELCLRAATTLGLRFTGMDLKRGTDGAWRILELNPSPMFLGFDARAGTDVLGRLAGALCRTP